MFDEMGDLRQLSYQSTSVRDRARPPRALSGRHVAPLTVLPGVSWACLSAHRSTTITCSHDKVPLVLSYCTTEFMNSHATHFVSRNRREKRCLPACLSCKHSSASRLDTWSAIWAHVSPAPGPHYTVRSSRLSWLPLVQRCLYAAWRH